MRTSETVKEIAAALAKAQGEFPAIPKNKTAKAGPYSYDYADLADIIAAVQPSLARNGIAHIQSVQAEGSKITVTTRLLHASGEWIESDPLALTADSGKPQQAGSATTYARRYGLAAMLGVAPEADDDAQAAQSSKPDATAAAAKVKAAAAKQGGNAIRVPQTPEERKADLKARMTQAGIPGAKMAEQLAEWIGRPVDKETVLTADDWSRADEAMAQASKAADAVARARTNVQKAGEILNG